MSDIKDRARSNCIQDRCENVPFSSVGGLEKRSAMVAPAYIPEACHDEYLAAYRETALELYGDDWETCEFGWRAAVTIADTRTMRRFELHRDEDETGISGTGIVAEGVRFSDGSAAMRWRTSITSHAVYSTMADVEKIHGHDGSTRVVWMDS